MFGSLLPLLGVLSSYLATLAPCFFMCGKQKTQQPTNEKFRSFTKSYTFQPEKSVAWNTSKKGDIYFKKKCPETETETKKNWTVTGRGQAPMYIFLKEIKNSE